MRPVVLCFAGLDPSGGAGLQADVETIAALGGHAAVVCTALTVQDSNAVHGFTLVDPVLAIRQAAAVLADLPVAAVKLGMLGSPAMAGAIAGLLAEHPQLPLVLDPVLGANSGGALGAAGMVPALLGLLPRATLLTPNSPEARRLGDSEDLEQAVATLRRRGARHILLKGGHDSGPELINRLYDAQGVVAESRRPRLPGEYHGSGCTLAAAIALGLARGQALAAAVAAAETFVAVALARADRPRAAGQFLPVRIRP